MKKNVLIYNSTFFELSETFIYSQIKLLEQSFNLWLLGREFTNGSSFPLQHSNFCRVTNKGLWHEDLLFKIKWKLGFRNILHNAEVRSIEKCFDDVRFDLVHAHFGFNAIEILPIARKHNVPLVVSFHGKDASKIIYHQPDYFNSLPELFDYSEKIIIVSEHMRGILPFESRHESKIVLLPYSIDTEYFNGREHDRPDSQYIHILHSGRLVPKKGVFDLIHVFQKLLQCNKYLMLHILGDGIEKQRIQDLVQQLKIQGNVRFYGSQPQSEVRELLACADIFVLNSRTAPSGDMEGFPVSILEAMSMRKAVVSTYHAGIPDAIQNDCNGFLVPEEDNDALFEAIDRLVKNKALRVAMGEEARMTIESRYNQKQLKTGLVGIYESVM